MKINAAIIGGSGYTGLELIRILSNHRYVNLKYITSRQFKNIPIKDIFHNLSKYDKLKFISPDIEKISGDCDIIFTALPHKASMEIVKKFYEKGKKVIDLSADFRFSDVNLYEKYYDKHKFKNLNEIAIYGLPEVNREKIKNAQIIGNPGCYPTSVILGLYPLLKNKIKISNKIIADSKSGVSGAGRNPSLKTIFTEVNENFSAYNIGKHRHQPEIEEQCSKIYNNNLNITFTPHLLPINRGILSTIYVDILEPNIGFENIYYIYKETYKNEPFIILFEKGKFPSINTVRETNYCAIGLHYNKETSQLIIVSVIDNLVKGASGQAVQNMNIMFGFEETEGLDFISPFV